MFRSDDEGPGQADELAPARLPDREWSAADTAPLARPLASPGLLTWSRRFLAVFLIVSGGTILWFGIASPLLRGSHPNLDTWLALAIAIVTVVTAASSLILRAIARYVELQVKAIALRDPLTDLGNRVALFERLEASLDSQPATGRVGVLFIDLDHFKTINDTLGHEAGDSILTSAARRLEASLRPSDTIARLGGDEFVVVLPGLRSAAEARRIADRIMLAMRPPVLLGGKTVPLSASIGIAVGRPRLASASQLLREADVALYRAKTAGRARYVAFETEDETDFFYRAELEADLLQALDRGELKLCYQPEVSLETGEILGAEALLRWDHPDRGLLLPSSFLTIAEENGALVGIGAWVLEESCRQLRRWQKALPGRPLWIGVNLSVRQLKHPDFATHVARALSESGVPPASLKLELREDILLAPDVEASSTLETLKRMGVKLTLDDFRSADRSLTQLKELSIDTVKLDRSFVSGLGSGDASSLHVQAIVTLAHELGIDVTAEGVETPEQMAFLQKIRCDNGQGFYLARPLTPDEMDAMIALSWREIPNWRAAA